VVFDVNNTVTAERTITGGTSFADTSGFWEIYNSAGQLVVWLDADNDQNGTNGISAGALNVRSIGTGGLGGEVNVQDNLGFTTVELRGGSDNGGGTITLNNSLATPANTLFLNANGFGGGGFFGVRTATGSDRVRLFGDVGDGGEIDVHAADGSVTMFVSGQGENSGGDLFMRNDSGQETVKLVGDGNLNSGEIRVRNRNGTTNAITVEIQGVEENFDTGGAIRGFNSAGNQTFFIDTQDGAANTQPAWMRFLEDDGSTALEWQTLDKVLSLHNAAGTPTITFNGQTGAKNAVVQTSQGSRLMYCQESTGVWFEDFGSGRLVDGIARVDLDPLFLETVTIDQQHPMKVFITLNGEALGVWVEKQQDHFIVRELMNGRSNAEFDYRVIAVRKTFEGVRMAPFVKTGEAALEMPANRRQVAPVDGPRHENIQNEPPVTPGTRDRNTNPDNGGPAVVGPVAGR
jgi:hypothetical protein